MHLLINTLKSHSFIFSCAAPILFSPDLKIKDHDDVLFLYSVRQYICLTFTRNITSVVPLVFDLAMDLFGQILLLLRPLMKV